MTDIVERLRNAVETDDPALDEYALEAADEIYRLRAERTNLRAALDHWFALVPRADRAQFPFTGRAP
jgi:hypothetical protein